MWRSKCPQNVFAILLFLLVTALYCLLVFDVWVLSNVNLFHMHVYLIYSDYIHSFKEGNQGLYSVDFCEHGNIFDVTENVQWAPEAAVYPAHVYLMNFRGSNWTIWNDRQTHTLDIFLSKMFHTLWKRCWTRGQQQMPSIIEMGTQQWGHRDNSLIVGLAGPSMCIVRSAQGQ